MKHTANNELESDSYSCDLGVIMVGSPIGSFGYLQSKVGENRQPSQLGKVAIKEVNKFSLNLK